MPPHCCGKKAIGQFAAQTRLVGSGSSCSLSPVQSNASMHHATVQVLCPACCVRCCLTLQRQPKPRTMWGCACNSLRSSECPMHLCKNIAQDIRIYKLLLQQQSLRIPMAKPCVQTRIQVSVKGSVIQFLSSQVSNIVAKGA